MEELIEKIYRNISTFKSRKDILLPLETLRSKDTKRKLLHRYNVLNFANKANIYKTVAGIERHNLDPAENFSDNIILYKTVSNSFIQDFVTL